MTMDLESSLREELATRADATTTSPDGLAEIVARSRDVTRRPTWRRPILAVVGAVAILGAAVTVATHDSEHRPVSGEQAPYAGPLPPVRPLPGRVPEAVGSVSGQVGTGCRGSEDCFGGSPARVDLSNLDSPEELPVTGNLELSDGRRFESTPTGGTAPWGERGMPEWWLVDPANGSRVSLGAGFLETATALADGRIAVVWAPITNDSTPELRIVDAQATSTQVDMPGGFRPDKITVGPEGWYAVLGTEDPCCELQLLLVAPDGAQRRLVLHGRDRLTAAGPVEISWGDAGFIAVSPQIPDHWDEGDAASWVTIVDPHAGEVMATFDGWLGTAWSPDGTALLVAQPTGPDATRLALVWGPGFTERTDVGTVATTFTPHDWDRPTDP